MEPDITNLIYEQSEFEDSPLKTRNSVADVESLVSPAEEKRRRAKSSLRMKYEAEVEIIQRKLGSLDQMRETLGLSQRKMCQLLMVDPSAWTRWNNGEDDAPPHIYRMLQWYLALEDKYPALDVNFWLSTVAQIRDPAEVIELRARLVALEKEHEAKTRELERALAQTNQNLVQAAISGQNYSEFFAARAERRTESAEHNALQVGGEGAAVVTQVEPEADQRGSGKLHALAMGASIGAAIMAAIQFLFS